MRSRSAIDCGCESPLAGGNGDGALGEQTLRPGHGDRLAHGAGQPAAGRAVGGPGGRRVAAAPGADRRCAACLISIWSLVTSAAMKPCSTGSGRAARKLKQIRAWRLQQGDCSSQSSLATFQKAPLSQQQPSSFPSTLVKCSAVSGLPGMHALHGFSAAS